MPKASSSAASPSARPSLRRNQVSTPHIRQSRPVAHHLLRRSLRPASLVARGSSSVPSPSGLPQHRPNIPQKCDAARPHCGTCVKWVLHPRFDNSVALLSECKQAVASAHRRSSTCGLCVRVPFCYALCCVSLTLSPRHPTEPQCSYDPIDGLPIAPDTDPVDRIRMLEEQIGTSQFFETSVFGLHVRC